MNEKTNTKPDLTDTLATLGEIRDHLRHHPRWCDALLRMQEGLQEAETVIQPFANIDVGHRDGWELMRTIVNVGRVKQAREWLAKHGARP